MPAYQAPAITPGLVGAMRYLAEATPVTRSSTRAAFVDGPRCSEKNMTTCSRCGAKKAQHVLACESCSEIDARVAALMMHGTPGLSVVILALAGLTIYRFWILGWAAWPGNLRAAARAAVVLAGPALFTGSAWPFGIRRRRDALIWLAVAVPSFLVLNRI